jgi:uncharacterized membrane protein (DUF2068 family)
MKSRQAIRAVAVFEALKGAVVLLAATGLLSLIHKDVHEVAARLVEHAHLNPAAKYPRILIDAASHINDANLLFLALAALAYTLLRGVEAYGLFHERAWAEIFAAASGAFYVPFEVIEFHKHPDWLSGGLLCLNLGVVGLMIRALLTKRAARQGDAA